MLFSLSLQDEGKLRHHSKGPDPSYTGASSSPDLITFGRVAVLVVSEPPPQFRHKIYFVLRGKRQRKTLCQCVI